MPRYPQAILAACPVPWDADLQLMEGLFRREVRAVLDAGFRHVYVFGTGSEGYGVDTARFQQIVRVFREETDRTGVTAMIGVIGMSTPIVLERLAFAHQVGFRAFQISLPAWGAVNDTELVTFFTGVCGAFPDSIFLNYNLPRTKRVLTAADYRRVVDLVPNLVATKSTGGWQPEAVDLVEGAGELQHFFGETNFPFGAMVGEAGLLTSYGEMFPEKTRELFEAGTRRDVGRMFELGLDFHRLGLDLWGSVPPGPHMDGAFDKMIVKLGMLPEFPLHLLPPYQGFEEADYGRLRQLLDTKYRDWR